MAETLPAGALVRIKTDPGRIGTTTGKSRARGDDVVYQVRFPEGPSYVPDYELELLDDNSQDLYALLEKGQFGSIQDLRRSLTHIQLTGRLANLVYSMDTTNTQFHAYQFKPVLSFLDSPSRGLLIADEVGLGKTIEAGLIWTEIRARFDARRLLVVCPAMLCPKWKDELASKFSIEAQILSAGELLQELRNNRATVTDGRAIVCSMQGIRPPGNWKDEEDNQSDAGKLARFLDAAAENDPLIDMVVIDESHYLRNPETQTAALGQLLRGVTDHIVLLSATPVNLREDDLYYQLNLVDPDFFSHKDSFPQVLRANEPLVRARELVLDRRSATDQVLACLQEASRHELLAESGQLADLLQGGVTPEMLSTEGGRIRLANRIEKVNLLAHAVSRTRKVEVHEFKVVREPHAYFVEMTETERAVYNLVTEAILRYSMNADINSAFLLASPQRQTSSCIYAAVKAWRARAISMSEQIYEDFGVEVDDERGVGPIIERLIQDVVPHVNLAELRATDSKYEKFRQVLLQYLHENLGEKVVVFSYYPGTLEYLQERLVEDGLNCLILHGSIKESKQEVLTKFRSDSKCRALLSSEVASEGVDLQFCRVLVNYDLPWNPMKVEQRIGRLDRLGQEAEKISILNLGHADTIDHRIYERLMQRLQIFTRALGGLEGILGDVIKELTKDLLSTRLTPEQQEERIQQSAMAVEQIRQQQDKLEEQASHMIAHGGYILEQVQAAHDFKKRITSEDLEIYVRDYLTRYSQGFQYRRVSADDLLFDIKLPNELAATLEEFVRRQRLLGQTALASGEEVRCRFKNKLALPSRKEEVVSQFHPLIRFISDDLRSRGEAFHQLVAVAVNARESGTPIPAGVYAVAVHRWSFSGLKQDEQLQIRAVRLEDGKLLGPDQSFDLINHARVTGNSWLSAANDLDSSVVEWAIEQCISHLKTDLEEVARERRLDNGDRVQFQLRSAERHRDRQLSIQADVLTALRTSGRIRMIPAAEGKIRKIRERFGLKEEQLRQKLQFHFSPFDVCFGVIAVV